MTKKELLVDTALELFAQEGFNATSTSKIAKQAQVSEGLIFRHFGSKKGLLKAIIGDIEIKINELFAPIFELKDPKRVLLETLKLPFAIEKSSYNYWRLQFKLKWEDDYDSKSKTDALLSKLTITFTQLNYKQPELEAQLVVHILDAIASDLLKGNLEKTTNYQQFLIQKYGLI